VGFYSLSLTDTNELKINDLPRGSLKTFTSWLDCRRVDSSISALPISALYAARCSQLGLCLCDHNPK